ncbi:hypothetical protein LOKO_03452 [Halomonas chromatireducens]|uniref:Uncharacterized protein n=1 Tax=Halomonas chromatireducens TaxID=507626 RepID=A0A120JWT4_9GAMM|nr:hypothetical protein LOKO_03452 [Halomonas chromatireducens]
MMKFHPFNFDALVSDTFALCRWLAKHVRRWHQAHANKNHRRDDRR